MEFYRTYTILCIAVLTILFSHSAIAQAENYNADVEFEYSYYTGNFENGNITFDPIYVTGDNGSVQYYLEGDNIDYFRLVVSGNRVNILLQRPFTDDFIEETDFMIFTLYGSYNGSLAAGRTAIHLFFSRRANCHIDGVTESEWLSELVIDIVDTHTGITFRRSTNDILNITDVQYVRGEIISPPYLNINLTNGEFSLSVNNRFSTYENLEVSETMTVVISFKCARDFRTLTIVHKIRDTNNNAPQFLPGSQYNFTIFTPMVAGIPFTMLYGDIIVRDVDLTNIGITPLIEPNEYFRLEYRGVLSGKKDHRLALVTTKAITSISAPISFYILATDNDTTGYPALSSFATVTVRAEEINKLEFQQRLYEGIYDLDRVTFNEAIRFNNFTSSNPNISFALTGDYSENFRVNYTFGDVTILVLNTIPEEVIMNRDYIILNLTATSPAFEDSASTFIHLSLLKDPTCLLNNVSEQEWLTELTLNILDTDYNSTANRIANNIISIESIDYEIGELNYPEYVNVHVSLINGTINGIIVDLTPSFINYEKNELSQKMTTYVTFKCTRGRRTLKIVHNIRDTNNHSPEFLPTNVYNYVLDGPVNSNFPISTVYGDILVRDVDLTNTAIIPFIATNDFVKLEYKEVNCDKKTYKLVLNTIRPIIMSNFTLTVNITATDFDFTGDVPRRSTATVYIRTLNLYAEDIE